MKKLITLLLTVSILLLSGCTDSTDVLDIDNYIDLTDTDYQLVTEDIITYLDDSFFELTSKDMNLDQYYQDYTNDFYEVLNDDLYIDSEGVYVLEGTYTETIFIDCLDDEDVTLVLNNATINVPDGPAIVILGAEDVIISSLEGTVNTISDGSTRTFEIEDEEYNAAIYSYVDVFFNGEGTLNIEGNYNNAVNSKDDIKILEVTLNITSIDDGIIGNDSISISEAVLNLDVTGDGLVSENIDSTDKGYIYIESGTITIDAEQDAIQAVNNIYIYTGIITINSGDNGIQSDTNILVGGGEITVDSDSDGFNSKNAITILGGTITINSIDDGIHADVLINIYGGVIDIERSYEGIEAYEINIAGGEISVYATDDGINCTTGGGQEHGTMYVSLGGILHITGGIIQVNAVGDGVDVNGEAYMSGGYLIVYGPTTDMQSAIDFDDSFEVSGGTIIAMGSTGMMHSLSSSSSQPSLLYADSTNYSAGTVITLTDEEGNTLVQIESVKSFAGIVLSTPDMEMNQTYTLSLDNDSYEFTISSIVTNLGTGGATQPMPGRPGRP